ncbi:Bug family tripartite tricarboxylate transporter substrate binding protein [Sabulicella glaciei]|uniref:Tripartite tricarboxylate transporter substrate binding protein n=1 Tax=Sabulicella glaciei TaxID=2984948 RepID=A0ABT3NTH0_9PROT|nr:tripartite tricarboxylate transporter substrate binding protein [Roseococcus sp. MDT2-1-1]MCW8085444.1 tripartite tricarboxylate transporter substrate binding protein [Roseococcus sp. MDT2-1-1]
MTYRMDRRGLLAAVASGLAAPALAQPAWPRQAVRIIVPAAGGGSSDPIARFCGQEFARRFGQPFVIENRPGASGNVGMAAAARAPADGHTLLFSWAGPLATNLALYRDLSFHSQRDFDPIARFGAIPNALVVGRNSPVRNLAEFVALARAKPGEASYGSTGSGSSMHLAGAMLASATGTQLTHVPYTSPAAAVADVIGGRLSAMFLGAPGSVPLSRSGEIRVLAVLSETRSAVLPDVPTAAEQGYPAVVMGTWFGWLAPKGTPRPVIQVVNAAANEILAGPGREWLLGQGLEIADGAAGGPPENLERFLASEIERHAALVRAANISVD